MTICVLQILLKKETSWALGNDEIGEVGGARKRKMKGFIQKRVFRDAVVNGGTGGKLKSKTTRRLESSLGTVCRGEV